MVSFLKVFIELLKCAEVAKQDGCVLLLKCIIKVHQKHITILWVYIQEWTGMTSGPTHTTAESSQEEQFC